MSHRSLAGQITINNHVAEIPMLKHLVRQKVQNRRLLAVTIRASNPQNLLLRALRARYEIRADRPRCIIQASLGLLCLLRRRRTVPSIIEHSNGHLESRWAHTNEAPACVENLTGKHLKWANPGPSLPVYTAGGNCSVWALRIYGFMALKGPKEGGALPGLSRTIIVGLDGALAAEYDADSAYWEIAVHVYI